MGEGAKTVIAPNAAPPKTGIFDHLFELLGKRSALVFGRECASVMIWMICILLLLDSMCLFPSLQHSFPLLPVRIAETVLGRMSVPHLLLVVFPSHFIGCILGVVIFRATLSNLPVDLNEALSPPHGPVHAASHVHSTTLILIEASLLCVYSSLIIATPELLSVNRVSHYLLSVPVGVLLLIAAVASPQSCLHPAANGALWLVGGLEQSRLSSIGGNSSSSSGSSSSSLSSDTIVNSPSYSTQPSSLTPEQALLQTELLLGPLLGGIIAGLVCNRFFPDDPVSWKRH